MALALAALTAPVAASPSELPEEVCRLPAQALKQLNRRLLDKIAFGEAAIPGLPLLPFETMQETGILFIPALVA